jgi:hypothetical protein
MESALYRGAAFIPTSGKTEKNRASVAKCAEKAYYRDMLDTEDAFYEAHKEEFRQQYAGKHVVIIEETLIGAYDTKEEARVEGLKRAKPGEFMLRPIHANPEDDTILILPAILDQMVC